MAITTQIWNRKSKRSKSESLLIVCLFALGTVCGCKPSYEQSSTAAPAPVGASSQVETQVKQGAQDFTQQLRSGNFTRAASFLTPKLQKQMTVAQLQEATQSGLLKPLVTANNVRYESVQIGGKAKRATLRFQFDTPQQKNYHMNLVFEQMGSTWKIATVVPPAKYEAPTSSQGEASASSK